MPFDRFPSGIFIAVVAPMAFLALLLSSKVFGITLGWIVQIFIVTVGFLYLFQLQYLGLYLARCGPMRFGLRGAITGIWGNRIWIRLC